MVTLWSDDFEDGDISDWQDITGTVVVTASPARGNYAIKAYDTSQGYSPDFSSVGETTVDYWQIQNAQENCYIYVFSAGDDALAGIRLDNNGNIQVFSKGAWSDTGYNYSINTWYHLKIILDPVNDRYNARGRGWV
ncbi:unnamed protein product [marine sediment metagenome]|uniref:Uncharacterized protein n=1 Tax=marine sediment metagenome TaxID=412755 RepID=X1HJM3_9ZZZZ